MINPIEALYLAQRLHEGQVDKAGLPYAGHLERVFSKLRQWNVAPSVLVAAALHDALEDGKAHVLDLYNQGVGRYSMELIHCLSRRAGEDYDAYIVRVGQHADARVIKLADLGDNLDPLRLLQLPPADRKRLYHKYNNALRYLLDIGAC